MTQIKIMDFNEWLKENKKNIDNELEEYGYFYDEDFDLMEEYNIRYEEYKLNNNEE